MLKNRKQGDFQRILRSFSAEIIQGITKVLYLNNVEHNNIWINISLEFFLVIF